MTPVLDRQDERDASPGGQWDPARLLARMLHTDPWLLLSLPLTGDHPWVHRAAQVATDLSALGEWLVRLPYGRPDSRDPGAVFDAWCGTGATKHALLAGVAVELGAPVQLMLGAFVMTKRTHPEVGYILDGADLPGLPEAHCFLRVGDRRLDLSGLGERRLELYGERPLAINEINDFKQDWQRARIAEWQQQGFAPGWTVDELWDLRERCAAALG